MTAPAAASAPASVPAAAAKHTAPDTRLAVRAVVLQFSTGARGQLAADPRFNEAALQAALETQLRSHGLLVSADPAVQASLQITIEGFTVRPAANAVVLGYVFSSALLTGSAEVSADPVRRQAFAVSAHARLAEKGQAGSDADALQPLYQRFALLAVDELRGAQTPPEPVPR